MKLRNPSLQIAALAALSASQSAFAQQTIVIPNGSAFIDELNNPINASLTATVGSSFVMGNTVNLNANGGTPTLTDQTAGLSYAADASLAIFNSAYPGLFGLVTDLGGVFGTFTSVSLPTGPKAMTGSIIGLNIASGTVTRMELWDSFEDAPGLPDESIANASITLNVGPAIVLPTAIQTFNLTGTFNAGGNAADPLNSIVTATANTGYVLGGTVRVNSGLYTSLNGLNWPNDVVISVTNSSFPGSVMTFTPYNGTGVIGNGATLNWISYPQAGAGGLVGAVIPNGSTFSFEFTDFDDDPAVDSTVQNPSFGFTGTIPPTAAANIAFAGPIPVVDGSGDLDNAVLTGVLSSTITLGPNMLFSGSYTAIASGDWASDVRVRIRSVSSPTVFADLQPLTANSGAPLTVAGAIRPLNGGLVGSSLSSGSTLSFEFWQSFNDGAPDIAESQLTNVNLGFVNGPAYVPQTPPSSIDLGVVNSTTAPESSPLLAAIASLTGPQVVWRRFTLPANVSVAGGTFLDIYTNVVAGGSTDPELALFDNIGRLVAFDSDDNYGFQSQLSFGLGGRAEIAPPGGESLGLPFTGVDGSILGSGTYYLAVTQYQISASNGFAVTSTSAAAPNAGTSVALRTNVAGSSANLTGTLNLADTSATFAFGRNIGYVVKQGATTIASGSVLANAASSGFSISVPSSATGAATIEWDGSSFLMRKTNINLTGSNLAVGSVSVQNGDVDNSGEVDAADIDEVIADFGITTNDPSDVDVSGEVDAADIDIVIANFGGVND